MKIAMKQEFSEEGYRSILKNVNQQGVDMGFRKTKIVAQRKRSPERVPDENSA